VNGEDGGEKDEEGRGEEAGEGIGRYWRGGEEERVKERGVG
jgi:hypothetical protein